MNKARRISYITLLMLLFQQGFFLVSQEIVGTTVALLEPIDIFYETPDVEGAVDLELENLRYMLSAMVYGYTFEYYPGDKVRQIEERFVLVPRAEIIRGDKALTISATDVRGDRLHIWFRYALNQHQLRWIRSQQGLQMSKSMGIGSAPIIQGPGAKVIAIQEGIRESIRNHLRALNPNKPQHIKGFIIVSEVPVFYLESGAYHAKVQTFFEIDTLQYYDAF